MNAYCEGRKIATIYFGKFGRWYVRWESYRTDDRVKDVESGKRFVENLWHGRLIEWRP